MSAESVQAGGAIASGKIDVLYLFALAIQWRNGDQDAGWELLDARTSSDPGTQAVAEALSCCARE